MSALLPAAASATDRAWMRTGSLNAGRTFPVAVTLQDGRALIAGGDDASAELFDPASGRWAKAASMTTARSEASAVVMRDGRVLVVGGDAFPTAEVYDPRANTWTATGTTTEHHFGVPLMVLADGRVLAVRSRAGEIYDPATNAWRPIAQAARSAYDSDAVRLLDGRVLVVGLEGRAALYEPSRNAWANAAPMLFDHTAPHAVTLRDGRVLVTGGSEETAELFAPATGTWARTGSLATGHGVGGALLLGADGTPVIVGGAFDGVRPVALAETYDVATGTWTPTAPMQVARWGAGVTALADGSILAAGGHLAGTASERFVTPPRPATDPQAPGPAPPVRTGPAPVPAGVLAFVKPLPRTLEPARSAITVRLRCTGGACRDTLRLMRWNTTLAKGAIVAADGQTATVKLKLSRPTLRKLHGRTASVSLELTRSHLTRFARLRA